MKGRYALLFSCWIGNARSWTKPSSPLSAFLHVELLRWGRGRPCPGDIAPPKVAGAVVGVPGIVTACPGQMAGEGRVQIEKGPSNDSVVAERDVQADNTNGKADACGESKVAEWHPKEEPGLLATTRLLLESHHHPYTVGHAWHR